MAKYGVREVADLVFKAKAPMTFGGKPYAKGQPVMVVDSAKSSTLEGTSSQVYAQGGRGNPKRVAWSGEKVLTFKFQDALISPMTASILMGAGVSSTTGYNQHVFGTVTCVAEGVLDCSGIVGDSLFLSSGEIAPTSFISADTVWLTKVTDGDMTIGEASHPTAATPMTALPIADAKVGDRYMVDGYVLTTKGTSLTITPDKFSGSFEIIASTLWRREIDGVDVPAQITIPNGSIQTAFTLTQSPSGDPSTFDFTVDALPDYLSSDTKKEKKVQCQIDILD